LEDRISSAQRIEGRREADLLNREGTPRDAKSLTEDNEGNKEEKLDTLNR
jgi:hypothetical protein